MLEPWRLLATLALAPEANTEDVRKAWNWSLKIKGRSLDTLVQFRQAQQQLRADPVVAELANKITQLRDQIANLAVNPPADLSPSAVQDPMARLRTELDGVVGELNRATSVSTAVRTEVSLAALRQQASVDTAIVEFVRLPLCNWQNVNPSEMWSSEHMLHLCCRPVPTRCRLWLTWAMPSRSIKGLKR